mmetsp:Transcript_21481/g.44784  ORF Transcript_21481/g.44784 Transcript_21481/m.44784 type:complete len:230 (-) Transcript_21481:765-1454(-)
MENHVFSQLSPSPLFFASRTSQLSSNLQPLIISFCRLANLGLVGKSLCGVSQGTGPECRLESNRLLPSGRTLAPKGISMGISALTILSIFFMALSSHPAEFHQWLKATFPLPLLSTSWNQYGGIYRMSLGSKVTDILVSSSCLYLMVFTLLRIFEPLGVLWKSSGSPCPSSIMVVPIVKPIALPPSESNLTACLILRLMLTSRTFKACCLEPDCIIPPTVRYGTKRCLW